MSFSSCPQCGLPRDSDEAGSRSCPLCGWDPNAAENLVPSKNATTRPVSQVANTQPLSLDSDPEPLSLDPDPEPRRFLFPIVIVIVAAVAGVIAGLIYTQRTGGKETSANSSDPETAPASPTSEQQPMAPKKKIEKPELKTMASSPPPKKTQPLPKHTDVKKLEVKKPEIAPKPRVAVEKPMQLPMPKEGEVVVNGDIEQINLPQGEFVIDSLKDDTRRLLRGEVKILRIGSVGGKVVIDASQLKAKKIIITGSVEGEGVLKLHAPEGAVEFRGKVEGMGSVEIDAPRGVVRFVEPTTQGQDGSKIDGSGKVSIVAQTVELHGKIDGAGDLKINASEGTVLFAESTEGGREGSKIGGGARVNITARELEFRGRLDGSAEIRVTLNSQGKIRYREMAGGAKILYRKSKPGDPEPIIEAGELKGGAEVKKVP